MDSRAATMSAESMAMAKVLDQLFPGPVVNLPIAGSDSSVEHGRLSIASTFHEGHSSSCQDGSRFAAADVALEHIPRPNDAAPDTQLSRRQRLVRKLRNVSGQFRGHVKQAEERDVQPIPNPDSQNTVQRKRKFSNALPFHTLTWDKRARAQHTPAQSPYMHVQEQTQTQTWTPLHKLSPAYLLSPSKSTAASLRTRHGSDSSHATSAVSSPCRAHLNASEQKQHNGAHNALPAHEQPPSIQPAPVRAHLDRETQHDPYVQHLLAFEARMTGALHNLRDQFVHQLQHQLQQQQRHIPDTKCDNGASCVAGTAAYRVQGARVPAQCVQTHYGVREWPAARSRVSSEEYAYMPLSPLLGPVDAEEEEGRDGGLA